MVAFCARVLEELQTESRLGYVTDGVAALAAGCHGKGLMLNEIMNFSHQRLAAGYEIVSSGTAHA